jgi:Endonuclease NucS
MPNQQKESLIRDWLADNLDFIENGLQLIGKEYHLKDNIGAKGFVDLLCKDIYNNFVLIEIKRAQASSRQTITEVLKYYSLLKHNLKARESEIRIIIISTHWDELIRAFSETFHKTKIALKGYQITINEETCIPHSINLVTPLEVSLLTRKFAFWYGLYLFETTNKRALFHEKLAQRLRMANVNDYVTVDLDAPKENKKIVTSYALVAAFQRQSPHDLLQQVKTLYTIDEGQVMEREEFDDENSYQTHLEGAFIDSLDMFNHDDDADSGYAEKLDSMINSDNWVVRQINRFGLFKSDPRYTDDLLIAELKGHDGSSRNKFVGFAELSQTDRIKELREQCMNSLMHTPQWASFIEHIFKSIEEYASNTRILIDIYNPDSVIASFYFTMTTANPAYLPFYIVLVDHIESQKTDIYRGELLWNGKEPINKLFTSSNPEEISQEVFRLHLLPDNETDSFKTGLIYTNRKIVIENNEEVSNEFFIQKHDEWVLAETNYKLIEDFIITNQDKIRLFIYNYGQVYRKM